MFFSLPSLEMLTAFNPVDVSTARLKRPCKAPRLDRDGFERELVAPCTHCDIVHLNDYILKQFPCWVTFSNGCSFSFSDDDLDCLDYRDKCHGSLSWSERTSLSSPEPSQNECDEKWLDKDLCEKSPEKDTDREECGWISPRLLNVSSATCPSQSPNSADEGRPEKHFGLQLPMYVSHAASGLLMDDFAYSREVSDNEDEAQVPKLDDPFGGWALGMERARLNLGLLEQAMHRQLLHGAYREMDRFLLERVNQERRQMDARAVYHNNKGNATANKNSTVNTTNNATTNNNSNNMLHHSYTIITTNGATTALLMLLP